MSAKTPDAKPGQDVAAMDVTTLIDHILSRYHETHRSELPDLVTLARKVERVHHDVPNAPLGLADALERISIELDTHMKKEEFVLYPAMQRGLKDGIAQPIAVMRNDHDHHSGFIRQVENLTRGFSVPEGACSSWQRLYAGTQKLCADLREHIRVENEVLFPRFELMAKGGCICSHG